MAKVSLRAYNHEIETQIDRGQLDEAVAHCKHILKTFPKHLETYRLLGKAYLEYKRHGDAADIFSRLIAAVPDDFVAHVGMSIIHDEANKLDEAIWHMERAFETQPSNPAIQGELQRLYGRREGVQPPRIRMTRGALAHMYVQGELYPQAISEIRSVLKEDPGRVDMQVLLARAYYRSGLKNDAADVASALLRTNPYCLDANRVLLEILGPDHPDSVQAYRQRVVELDPYAAQVAGSIFLANEVPDAAVSLEKLDWNGQPVGMQADWASTQAISLESGRSPDEQPEWLTGGFGGAAAPASSSQPFDALGGAPSQPEPVSAFDMATPSAKPPEPVDEIPDFLRAAGWGQSTGAFDESKAAFADEEPVSGDQPLEQGDLPDWIKAMAPEPPAETPAQEEDLPDWINKIGTSALPVPSESSSQPSEPAAQPADDQPDWLKQFAASKEPAAPVAGDQPDWAKEFESKSETPESVSNEFDFLNQLGSQPEPEVPSASQPSDDFDFLNELKEESAQLAPSTPEPTSMDNLGTSQAERDDSFAWLENLAAKQGATEGLLTKPEERLEKEPEWVQQAKTLGAQPQEIPPAEPPRAEEPPASVEEFGKSEQERDDSFAWLENLAAKQGASEGLLTKPEERLEKEPEWVQQAKTLGAQPQETPPAQPPAVEPPASAEELGKSEQERDDSFAWLENLAAKQGASEGLLTKPEERRQEEPDWVKQAKDLSAQQPPAAESPPAPDDTAAWLRSLDQEETAPAPASAADDTAMWLKSLDEPEQAQPEPAQPEPAGDLPGWMQDIPAEEPPAAAVTAAGPAQEAVDENDWMRSLEEPVAEPPAEAAPKVDTGSLPSWLRGLDQETPQESVPASQEDLPVWLRDETGEAVAEPAKIEPTRPTDWRPVETAQPEPAAPEPVAQAPQPEPQVPQEKPAAPVEKPKKPAASPKPEPYREPATRSRDPGAPGMAVDPILGQARNELSRSNIPGALETYGRLIKKGRFLDEVIYDLRDALYRYPVEVSIWQALGDAYMRANRLQDALDAYTKAEELLR